MEERECQCPSGLYLIPTLGRKPEPCASVVMCQCPLGLIPHFYEGNKVTIAQIKSVVCQCPLGLIPHFYLRWKEKCNTIRISVNALSGLYLISTVIEKVVEACNSMCQCPLGLIPHFYRVVYIDSSFGEMIVSMPSRAYTSFLQGPSMSEQMIRRSVSMPSRAYTSFLLQQNGGHYERRKLCQCPLGLIPHFYGTPSKT